MAHYAKVENGIVTQVIVAEQYFIDLISTENDLWVQTSYNTRGGIHYKPNTNDPSEDQSKALRKNFAGVGYTYDEINDIFIIPQPFDSWTLDANHDWQPPTPYPTDGKVYKWNEDQLQWDAIIDVPYPDDGQPYYWNGETQTWDLIT